jgi:hypothetical protein
MRQKLIPLTHHIKFEKENSHVQDRTWCCFFHIAIVHKVSNVDSYNDTRNCKPLQSEHLQLKEWSIFGILTNASKSMHVPPFEWHIHFLWSHMCLAWVPEHILRIIGNVIKIKIKWKIIHIDSGFKKTKRCKYWMRKNRENNSRRK